MNFIKTQLIEKIKRLFNDYDLNMQINGSKYYAPGTYGWGAGKFIYFDNPIKIGNKSINRINAYNPFYENEICSTGWYVLPGSQIIQIWKELKNNKVYILKTIDNKSYKIRKKV